MDETDKKIAEMEQRTKDAIWEKIEKLHAQHEIGWWHNLLISKREVKRAIESAGGK